MKGRFFAVALVLLALLTVSRFDSVTLAQKRINAKGAQVLLNSSGDIQLDAASGRQVIATSQVKVTKDPANTTNTSASLLVNPATSATNELLLGVLDNGSSLFTVDKEGDTATAGAMAVTGASTLTGGVTVGSGGTAVTKVISGSASLNFGATAAGACDVLTITVTGAADGDTVALGVPHALANADAYQVFDAWVSAADTVSVRRCNPINATTPLSDPAAATVRATVVKF